MYGVTHREAEAFSALQSLEEPTRKLYGANSVAYGKWSNNIASGLDGRGDHIGALQHYKEALAINLQAYGPRGGPVATVEFNIAGAAENAQQWDEADKYYRDCIDVARTAFPDSNENIEMFRTAYALFLNKRGRYAEAVPLFQAALARVERNAEFREDDVFKVATFGITIAEYGLEPSKGHLAEYEKAVALPADAGPDVEELLKQQGDVIASLGLPAPKKAAESPAKP
jgi:tetratricopeptide (TPR) repeat protein